MPKSDHVRCIYRANKVIKGQTGLRFGESESFARSWGGARECEIQEVQYFECRRRIGPRFRQDVAFEGL